MFCISKISQKISWHLDIIVEHEVWGAIMMVCSQCLLVPQCWSLITTVFLILHWWTHAHTCRQIPMQYINRQTDLYTQTHKHTETHTSTHAQMLIHTPAQYMNMQAYLHKRTHIKQQAPAHTCMHACMHACTHTHTHTHTHVLACTHRTICIIKLKTYKQCSNFIVPH